MNIRSKRIICEHNIIEGCLHIEDGIIQEILPYDTKQSIAYDAGNDRIFPGFFDTHNHGTQGYSLMKEADETEIKGYLKGLASQGVTSVFPTCDLGIIQTISNMAKQEQDGAKIVGIHSEGPWLNRVGEKGIKTEIPVIDMNVAKTMVADGQGLLRLVAIAPELPHSEEVIAYFLSQGVTVAFAHSDDTYEEANQAISQGIRVATHLGNVMTGLHHRDIGGFGACLLRDEITCELICDGTHISLPMIQLILKVKDHDKIMMISDSTPMAGAPVGRYRGFGPGMEYINVNEEGFVLSDQGRLCGSSQGIIYGVYNLIEKLHLHPCEVAKLSSFNACKMYGLQTHKGSIAVGKDADLVILNDEYNVKRTYSEGRVIYDHKIDVDVFNPTFLEANIR